MSNTIDGVMFVSLNRVSGMKSGVGTSDESGAELDENFRILFEKKIIIMTNSIVFHI